MQLFDLQYFIAESFTTTLDLGKCDQTTPVRIQRPIRYQFVDNTLPYHLKWKLTPRNQFKFIP